MSRIGLLKSAVIGDRGLTEPVIPWMIQWLFFLPLATYGNYAMRHLNLVEEHAATLLAPPLSHKILTGEQFAGRSVWSLKILINTRELTSSGCLRVCLELRHVVTRNTHMAMSRQTTPFYRNCRCLDSHGANCRDCY
jgi:hypothetical protein